MKGRNLGLNNIWGSLGHPRELMLLFRLVVSERDSEALQGIVGEVCSRPSGKSNATSMNGHVGGPPDDSFI